jgi:predicted metal-dependent hydrolase
MINDHAVGYIKEVNEKGEIVILARLPNLERAIDRQYNEVEVIFQDSRKISPEQRRKVYALLGEIAEFVDGFRNSETIEDAKNQRKWEFILQNMEDTERKMFSLSNCDMTLAREFISYLIDFIIKNDIPSSISLLDNCEDVGAYIYACLVNKKCCICGQAADLHHVEGSRIGQGNDRNEVHHLGRECLPLCRVHHGEAHQGEADFISKYHLEPVKIDEKICRVYRLKK